LGFEEVANNGTAYDLLHAVVPLAAEFFVPVAVALRLEPKPPARKTLTYGFDDAAKLATALDKLARTSAGVAWVHLTDAIAARVLRPSVAPDAVTAQVSIGGTATSLSGKEKSVDAAMTGFKTKSADLPNPFDLPADAYRKVADGAARSLFVGEVRAPAKSLADLITKIQALGEQSAAKAGFYASLRASGTTSLFPFFAAPKDRAKQHDLSKGVRTIVSKAPGAVFTSRLAHLWEEERGFLQRMSLLRSLKLTIDTAHVMQPLVAP